MLELCLALLRNLAAVDLVALAVIVWLRGQKLSSLVTSGTSGIPNLVDGIKLVVRFWAGGAIDVDSAAVGCFTRLVLRKGDMAVFLVSERDHIASGGREHWRAIGLLGLLLRFHAHGIGVDDFVAGSPPVGW